MDGEEILQHVMTGNGFSLIAVCFLPGVLGQIRKTLIALTGKELAGEGREQSMR